MYILGITGYTHDSSACLLKDGEIRAFIEEERLDRTKHSAGFPSRAIAKCLEMEQITLKDVDHITFFSIPYKEITGNLGYFFKFGPKIIHLLGKSASGINERPFLERIGRKWGVGKILQKEFSLKLRPKIRFVEHHLAHAASCFFPSPFQEAAILSLDGRGENTTTLLAMGRKEKISKLKEIPVPHSLGHFYSAITEYLGFRPFFDEWKVMGLSAYGSGNLLQPLQDLYHLEENGGFRLNLDYFSFHTHGQKKWLSEKFHRKFGPPRERDGPFAPRHLDLAYALQKSLERAAVHLARFLHEKTQTPNLCLAGGVALNCLMNSAIMDQTPFTGLFIQPIANDAGTSLGSALYYYHQQLGFQERAKFSTIYLGPQYSSDSIEEILVQKKLPFRKVLSIARETARYLAQNKVVGWFQGKMEAGPRALGNRSIVANPGDPTMKDRLNGKIKKREFFRPFAPSILEEHLHDYFDMPKRLTSPYMVLTGKVREAQRKIIPAVVHEDGTARVQTVGPQDNPLYYQLLKEFQALTGVPVLLNTSFNENEPIVCSPLDAINCFQRTEMDVLSIGDYLVVKENFLDS